MSERKRMPIEEFVDLGYLQEVNRRFLHPLGLALEVTVDAGGEYRLSGIWDCREDPEGIFLAGERADRAEKAAYVTSRWAERGAARYAALGFIVQPAAPPERERKARGRGFGFAPVPETSRPAEPLIWGGDDD